jgi:hypothetical protein
VIIRFSVQKKGLMLEGTMRPFGVTGRSFFEVRAPLLSLEKRLSLFKHGVQGLHVVFGEMAQ